MVKRLQYIHGLMHQMIELTTDGIN